MEPPTFKIGDEVCFWQSTINHTNTVIAIRTTTGFDGDESYQEICVKDNPYWVPASRFVRVRRVS